MSKKNVSSQKKGDDFESQVLDFFVEIFKEIGIVSIKERKQKAGTQNGHDLIESDNYNHFENIELIDELFDFLYLTQWKDSHRDAYYIKRFFEKYLENLVSNHYSDIKNLFESKIKTETIKDALFYQNRMLDLIEKKHISSLLKPMKFEDALKFVSY